MNPVEHGRGGETREGGLPAATAALPARWGMPFALRGAVGGTGLAGAFELAGSQAIRWVGRRRLVVIRSFIVFFIVWYLASLWNGNTLQLPSPLQVADAFGNLAVTGVLFSDALTSIIRLGISFAIAIVLAVPLGFVMGMSRAAERFIDPMVELLRPISGIAWIPMGMFIFGVGDTLPIFIMVYVAFFPLLLNTIAGVRNVDRRLVAAARTMGVGRWAMLCQVVMPASLPLIMVGLRLAFAGGWSAIIAAELIGSTSGLGYAVEWYHQLLMTPKTFAILVTIAIVGYVWDLGIRAMQRRLTPWAEGRGGTAEISTLAKPAFHLDTIPRATALPVLFVIAWQLWALGLPAHTRAPAPVHVVGAFIDLVAHGGLVAATAMSLMRVLIGFGIAMALGGGIGVLMGANWRMRESLDPIAESFRPIAPIALLPIAILWFGTGTPAAVFLVAYAAFFPALVNTVHAVSQVDRKLVQAAQVMGVPRLRILTRVVMPAAVPTFLLGARISMGVAWTAIVAAELAVGAKSGSGGTSGGIGQMMFNFYAYSIDQNGIVVCMIVVGVVALLLDRLFRVAERRLTPWRL